MSADTDQAATTAALLNGKYEWIQFERVAAFLGAHPSLVSLLEDLHCRLSMAFPGARCVLRHLASPRVPSPAGDGHLLVVIVPVEPIDDPSGRLSDLLCEWAPQQATGRAFLLVDVASAVVDPYASDADAVALYVRRRSEDYKKYLDAARRFVAAPSNSRERFHAATALSAVRRSQQAIALERNT
ncbi:MAG TPA: hypothetical protein VHB98_10485 [Chloroflexota bacterium]|jgi:hypothetical protein|nr:hypothetical protein [Chloroflexota bacterium]